MIIIKKEWCKGCGICIHFCPKNVLILKELKVYANKPEECTNCLLCELRCPDFAIEIVKDEGINELSFTSR